MNLNATWLIALLVACLLSIGAASADIVAKNPGDVFRECEECPEIVILPAGSFRMGDIAGGGFPDDLPVHWVTFPQAFAVGRYEVTVGQFRAFVEETGHRTDGGCNDWNGSAWEIDSAISWHDPGFDQSDQYAAGCMNWNDAREYAAWLAGKTGQGYRLLSEAEWEYVQRAGTDTLWFFGDDETDLCRYGNIRDDTYRSNTGNSLGARCNDGSYLKAPVGRYQANGFGIHDLIGNVYEWTQDCWNEDYSGAPANGSPWMTGDCGRHVLRGGSWPSQPRGLRSAFRRNFETGNRSNNFGFRIARALSP